MMWGQGSLTFQSGIEMIFKLEQMYRIMVTLELHVIQGT